jgi:KaiC/GvpD/RAD55 family RecA-like ATPase
MVSPDYKRRRVMREYKNVPMLLKKMFNIPDSEMIIRFEWIKGEGILVLETLKEFDKEKDI